MNNRSRSIALFITFAAALGLAAPSVGYAQSLLHAKAARDTQQLDQLDARIAVLEAKLKIAQLQAKLVKAHENKSGAATTADHSGQSIAGANDTSTSADTPRHTMVESISGIGHHMSALLLMPDDGEQIVTRGTRLPNHEVVEAITENGVEVRGSHGRHWLSFTSTSPSVSASQDPGSGNTSFIGPSLIKGP